jgi:uncharacterized membrane-anchored protein YjiN (DUF445 family)
MKGHENLQPIKDTKIARELQEKSVKKRKENQLKKKIFETAIRERLKDEDVANIIDNLIKRAGRNDKSLEVLRDTLGEKPTDKQEVTAEVNMTYEEYLKKVDDKDAY